MGRALVRLAWHSVHLSTCFLVALGVLQHVRDRALELWRGAWWELVQERSHPFLQVQRGEQLAGPAAERGVGRGVWLLQ
jgi:hypothetical protein